MPFVVGENVGPYRLIEQLGQGGMATVYKAYHPSLDRYVAIKALHMAFLDDDNFIGRFQREAQVVARLDHPNIVPVYDFSEHEGRPYLVMKFVEGETLKSRLDDGPLENDNILEIIEAISKALAYAHEQGVLHRDVKPSNIILSSDQQIYLVDFGLARMAQSGESSLTTDRIVGTPQYISPEQAIGKAELDARTDIYSFGITIYEMLIGEVPFHADTPFAVIHDHIYTPLPLPRQKNPKIPETVERVLLKTLAKDPEDRYTSATELVIAFQNVFNAETTPKVSYLETPLIDNDTSGLIEIDSDKSDVPLSEKAIQGWAKAETTPSQASDIPPAEKSKKSRTGLVIAIAGGTVIILLIIIAITAFVLLKIRPTRQAQATQTAAISLPTQPNIDSPLIAPQEAPPEDINQARALLEEAVQEWHNENAPGMVRLIAKTREAAGDNVEFYTWAMEYLRSEEAWLVAVILFFETENQAIFGELPRNKIIEISRELVYKAARDPMSARGLERNSDNPIMRIAPIRHELYNGDPQIAKNALGKILEQDIIVSKSPEAYLLEAEIFIVLNDPRANERLEMIRNDENMPEWIRIEADVLLQNPD